MHKVWELLLDPEFLHAYEHGIVLKCADGVVRRIFPRFFTYSADYPEKYVLSVIFFLYIYGLQGFINNHTLSWFLSMPELLH